MQVVFDGGSWDLLFHGETEIKRVTRKLSKLLLKIDKVELEVNFND